MPRKIRQLIADLERAGFSDWGGEGSHRRFRHANGTTVILSGKTGDDAHQYQEKDVQAALAATKEKQP